MSEGDRGARNTNEKATRKSVLDNASAGAKQLPQRRSVPRHQRNTVKKRKELSIVESNSKYSRKESDPVQAREQSKAIPPPLRSVPLQILRQRKQSNKGPQSMDVNALAIAEPLSTPIPRVKRTSCVPSTSAHNGQCENPKREAHSTVDLERNASIRADRFPEELTENHQLVDKNVQTVHLEETDEKFFVRTNSSSRKLDRNEPAAISSVADNSKNIVPKNAKQMLDELEQAGLIEGKTDIVVLPDSNAEVDNPNHLWVTTCSITLTVPAGVTIRNEEVRQEIRN